MSSDSLYKMSLDDYKRLCGDVAINPFRRLSYFEVFMNNGFISRFPTSCTNLVRPMETPFENVTLFRDSSRIPERVWSNLFSTYFKFIHSRNFGVNDLFWWLPNTQTAVSNAETLWEYISNVVIEPGDVTQTHQCVTIKNKLDDTFSVKAFFKNDPLPQEAIDVVPIFKTGSELYTALGYKVESPRVPVSVDGETLQVLTTGIYGNVIFGEHLEAHEKEGINSIKKMFMEMSCTVFVQHKVSAVMRTLAEEAGIKIDEKNTAMSYAAFDQTTMGEECRDARYGVLYDRFTPVYGYPRVSSAHTMVCLFDCAPPSNPIPSDRDECSKPTILPVSDVEKHFCIGGKFEPAFPAHVQQMNECLKRIKSAF